MNFFKLSTFYKLFNFAHKVIHELFSLSNSCTKGIFHKLIKTSVNALNFVFKRFILFLQHLQKRLIELFPPVK